MKLARTDSGKPVARLHALRVARIRALAQSVLGGAAAGREWLAIAQMGLDGRVPNDLLGSDLGASKVETLLNRMEHGVYT